MPIHALKTLFKGVIKVKKVFGIVHRTKNTGYTQETGDRRSGGQEIGDMRPGDRRRETGDRRLNAGDRRSGDRKQET